MIHNLAQNFLEGPKNLIKAVVSLQNKFQTVRGFSKSVGETELSRARKVSGGECGEPCRPRSRLMLSSSPSSAFMEEAQLHRPAKTQLSEQSPTEGLIDILFCFPAQAAASRLSLARLSQGENYNKTKHSG